MRFDVFTLFPAMFGGPFDESIIGRAIGAGLVRMVIHNIRDHATDRHRTTDDYPFGGGAGMVMRPEPIFAAVENVLSTLPTDTPPPEIILLSASGRRFTQQIAEHLAGREHVVLICGRYEGVDQRVADHLATDELSIGDYVLTGGELPAMVVIDAVTRLLPGVVSSAESTIEESYSLGLLEYPQYTRPAAFRNWHVPPVLISGNHAAVAKWRRERALDRTWRRRPDLLQSAPLTPADRQYLSRLDTSPPDDDDLDAAGNHLLS